jgi:SulP family sulfate permease
VIAGIVATRLLNLQGHCVALGGGHPAGAAVARAAACEPARSERAPAADDGVFRARRVETSAIGRMFGQKHGYRFDANQELLALGAVNLVSGLARGSRLSGSMSQTLVNPHAGVGVDRRRIHVESWRCSHRGCCGTGRSRCWRQSCSRRL